MKPERSFIAERPLAQHCPELLRSGPTVAELLPLFARFGERAARALAAGLAGLGGGMAPEVRAGKPQETTGSALPARLDPLTAHCRLELRAGGQPFLAAIDGEGILRLVDRAFGGSGKAPSPLPDAFPLSAELMIARVGALVAAAVAGALGGTKDAVTLVRHDADYAEAAPCAGHEAMAVLPLDIEEPGMAAWPVTLALPLAALSALFGHGERAPAARAPRAPAHPADEPYADVPMQVTAAIVDMRMPFAALSNLKAGDVIPVAVARSVPLAIGDRVIARGTIGAMDDRVAIQVTQAF